MSRPGRITRGIPRRDDGRNEPPDVERTGPGSSWWSWWDVFRGYPLVLVLGCMGTVIVADGLWLASEVRPDVATIMNGAAAVVCAIAALVEARNGRADRQQIADHEARLRVLEDRGNRS